MANNNTPPKTMAELFSGSHGAFSAPSGISTRNIVAERAAYAPLDKLGKYDVGMTPAIYETAMFANPRLAQQYYRADQQTAGKQLWNGFRSRSLSIPFKVGEGFGYLIGAFDAAAHQDTDRMYDNAIVKLFTDLDDSVKEALPVYQSKAYTEGNWIKKLSTTSFWATDGFDGLAFLASAYLPGGLFSKVGSASKWLMGVERAGLIGKASRGLGKAMAATTEATGLSTSSLLTTVYNTATEAGFEAHDVNTMLRQQIAQQKGFSSFEEAPEDVQDVIRDQAAQGAARTYLWNTAALLVPNFLQTKWLFGSKAIDPTQIIKKVRRGEIAADAAAKSKRSYLAQFGEGFASEGLWEENIQTNIQQYESRRAKGLHESDAVTGPLDGALRSGMSFAKSILTLGFGAPDAGSEEDEAGSAIALGGLIGGGMSLYGHYIENKQLEALEEGARKQWEKFHQINRANGNMLLEDIKSPYKTFGTTTIKDENGKDVTVPNYINPQTGRREHDDKKWTKILMTGAANQQLLAEAEAALASGDPHWQELNKQMALMAHVYRLAATGLKKEDVSDILQYDMDAILKEGEALGLAEDADAVTKDLMRYLDLFYEEQTESLKGLTSSSEDVAFGMYKHRNLYYMRAKGEALNKLEGLKDNEGLARLIEDNNQTYNFFIDNTKQAREMFNERLMPMDTMGKRVSEIRTELKKEGLSEEDQTKLSEELATISYMLEELKDSFGTTFLDYGENADHLSQPLTVIADGFRTQEASQLLRTDADSRLQRNRMAAGAREHSREDVERSLDNFLNQDDEDSLNDVVTIANDLGSLGEEHGTKISESINKLSEQRAQQDALAQELEDLTDPERLDSLLQDGMLTDTQKAFVVQHSGVPEEAIKGLAVEQIEEVSKEAIKQADALYKDSRRKQVTQENLGKIKLTDTRDFNKVTWPDLVEAHVEDRFKAVDNLLRSFEENPEGFLRGAETQEMFNQMGLVNLVFSRRTDTPKDFNESITKRAKDYMDRLQEVNFKVQENKARRIVIQQAAEVNKRDGLQHWTGFKNGSFSVNHPFRPMLLSALGNSEDRLIEVEKILANSIHSGSLEYLLLFTSKNASKETKQAYTQFLVVSFAELISSIDPSKRLSALKGVYNNPLKYGHILLQHTAGLTEQFSDWKSPFYAYAKDRDLTKLHLELTRQAGESKIIPGMDAARSAVVFEKINVIANMIAIRSLFMAVHANVDAKAMFEAELALAPSFVMPTEGGTPPSSQQVIAFREAVRNMFIPSTGQEGSEITVLKGILGSGKSLVGVKAAVAMWKQLTGSTDENIFAFGHSETSSEIIASSVYGDKKTIHSAQEFLTANISQVKLVVVDEAMAIDVTTWRAIYDRVLAENTKRTQANKIHILALGDPAQFTNEVEEATFVGGNINTETKDTSPLSVVYRTNVSSIVDMVMEFKDKPVPINFIIPTTSHGINDLLNAKNIDEFYGVNGGTLQQMLDLLNKPSTKERLVVVNNESTKKDMLTKVPAGVKVLTYFEAQSKQADQVFIYLDKTQPNHQGRMFDEAQFNSVMYTMIGRAKQSAFIGNPGLEIRTPIINEQLAKAKEGLEQDITANNIAYVQNVEETTNMIEALYPNDPIKKKEKETKTSERPVEDPKVTVEETEGTGGQPEETTKENGEKTPEQIIEPIRKPDTVEVKQKSPTEESITFSHSFAFPTNAFPDFSGARLEDSFEPGSEVRIVVTNPRGSKYPFQVEVVAQKKDGRWASIAVLSETELFEEGEGMKAVYEKAQQIPAASYITNLNRTSEGFEWTPEMDSAVVSSGNIQQAAGVQYELVPLGDDGYSLDDTLAIFYRGFYRNAMGGRGATPRVGLINPENLTVDWKRLSKYVTMKIFSRSALREWENRAFTPKAGIPYMVIEDPAVEGADVTRTQYLRFEPRKLLSSDPIMKTLIDLSATVDNLESEFPQIKLGGKLFTDLFGYYTDEVFKATENGAVKQEDVNTIEVFRKYRDESIAKMDMEKLAKLASHFDALAEYMLGVSYEVLYTSKEKAKKIVEEDQGREFKGFSLSKRQNNYYIKTNEGERYVTWQLSYAHSPAQKAIDAIATANSSTTVEENGVIKDVMIRTERFTTTRMGNRVISKFGKSLMAAERSEKNFYRHYRTFLRKVLTEFGIPEKELIDPKTNKVYAAFQLEAEAERLMKEYMSEDLRNEIMAQLKETRDELRTKFSVNPINSTTLRALTTSVDLRLPLIMQDFNKLGRDLGNEANRAKLASMVNGRVSRVIPTTITAAISTTRSLAPEQELERTPQKVSPKSKRHWTSRSKNLPVGEESKERANKFSPLNSEVDTANKVENWKSLLDINDPLTPYVLDLIDQMGEAFIGLFPVKADAPGWVERRKKQNAYKRYMFTLPGGERKKADYSTAKIVFSPSPSHNIFESQSGSIILLHELLHVATLNELMNNKDGDFFKQMAALRQVYDDYVKKNKLKRVYAEDTELYADMGDTALLAEFVANFSTPQFIENAKKATFNNKSVWNQILDAILNFLGLTDSNVYEAGLASLRMLYESRQITKESNGATVVEQTLDLKKFVEEKKKEAVERGGNSEEVIENIDYIVEDESLTDEEKVQEINNLFLGPLAATIAETLGADMSNLLNLETFVAWVDPELDKDAIKASKRKWEMLHQAFHSAMAYPEKKLIPRITKLVSDLATAEDLDLPLISTQTAEDLVNLVYNYVLTRKEKDNLSSAFDRKGAYFRMLPDNKRLEYLVDMYFATEAKLNKEDQFAIKKFVKDLSKFKDLITEYSGIINFRYKEAFRVEALADKLAAGNNIGTVEFIDKNFHSVEHYRKARNWVYENLDRKLRENGTQGVHLTRRQLTYSLYSDMAREIIRLKDLVNLGVTYSDATDIALEFSALRSMALEYNGAPILFYMLTEIYPNWTVASIEDIEQDFEAEEIDELTEGIRNETQENERQNIETKLSDSVKEFLSFIRNPQTGDLLGSKHTFFLAAKIVTQYLDTSMLDLWVRQYQTATRLISSHNEHAILEKLNTLIQEALSTTPRKDVAIWVHEDSMTQSTIGVAWAENGDIVDLAADEARAKADPKNYIVRKWTYEDAFNQLNSWGANITPNEFAALIRKAKALNSLRELHNSLSSLTEKNYMVGTVENDMGAITTSYINASGFGVDKSLASQVRGALFAFDQEKGINNLSEEPIIMGEVYPLLDARDPQAITSFLKFLGLEGLVRHLDVKATKSPEIYEAIKGFIDRSRLKDKYTTVDEFLEDQRSVFNAISRAVKYNIDALRQTSIVDSKGHKIHKMVPASYFYDTMNFFLKAANRKETGISGTTGSLSWMLRNIPEYLQTEFYKLSPFVAGNQKIYHVSEHDASTNANSLKITGFTRENDRQFLIRQFVHGFLDMIPTYAGQVTYGQFSYQPSNKPRIPVARIKLLNDEELRENLGRMYDQLKAYPDMSSMKTKASTKADEVGINASIMAEAIKKTDSKAAAIVYAYQKLTELSDQFLKTLLSEQIPVPHNLEEVKNKLLSSSASSRFEYMRKALEVIPSNVEVKKKTEAGDRVYDTQTLAAALRPLVKLFYMNNYVNSYFFNQLYTGPFDMFKSTDDVVKRIAGALGPGIKPFVDNQVGTSETFRVLVLDDRNKTETSIRDLMNKLLPDVSNKYSKEQREKDIEDSVRFFNEYSSTDAQGFMSEKRWNNLSKGYGAAWNLANVMKPIYFGIHSMPMMRNGEQIDFPVPVYSKLSSVKVSTDLAARYPGIASLKAYMEAHNIDEIHFASAVKLGRDKDLTQIEDIEKTVVDETGAITAIPPKNVMTLSNRNYRMQFNPKAKIDSTVSIFTQLMYFMNILGTNVEEVEDAYSAVALLMENALADLEQQFIKDGVVKEDALAKRISSAMNSPGTERIAQLLKAGVSVNNPTVANRAISTLAAMFEKSVQKIKFPGSKLVLQTEEFIKKNADPSVETASNVKSRLQYVKLGSGKWAAEVIVPQHLLTPDLRAALARGEDLYLTPDLFGFRIPSTELHSAVPLKIVGVYDSHETNVIIAPFELVYLHGSDFDVDSLFVIRRENLSENEKLVLGLEASVNELPVGYEQKGKKLVFSRKAIGEYLSILSDTKAELLKEAEINLEQADFYRKEISKMERLEKSLIKKYTKNAIFELMMQVITKPENRARMLTPIVMSNFNDLNSTESIASFLETLSLWESKKTKDLSKAEYALEAYKFVQDGAILVGVFANNIKVLSYLYRAGDNFTPAKVIPNLKFSFEVNGKVETFDGVSDIDRETGTLMWQYQDGLVNLAIDNLNEQTLTKLGVNLQTGNAFSALLGMGFPLKDAVLLMKTELSQSISKAKPFHKVPFIQDYRKEYGLKKSEKVLTRADLIRAAKGELDLNNANDKEILGAITYLLEKAYRVGESVFTTSQALKAIRSVPGTPEKLYNWKAAVNHVFGKIPEEYLQTSKFDSPWALKEAYKNRPIPLSPDSNYAFSAPNLLNSTPHVLASIKSIYMFEKILKNSIFKLSDGHREFAKDIKEVMQFREFGLDRIEEEDILEELEHFLFASLFVDRLDDVEDYQFRQRKTRLTGFSAFANRLADKINDQIAVERAKQVLDSKYKMNEFLENIVINRKHGVVQIRLASSVSPDVADIAAIRKGFDVLPKDLQLDLITYLVVSTGFKLTSTSYAPYVDEANFKDMDRKFLDLSKTFATDYGMRKRYKDAFKIALAFKYADKLPYFNSKQRKAIVWANKTDGFENGIYYDFKIHQEDLDPKDREYPMFIGVVNWPNEDDGRAWKEYEVYRRINDFVNEGVKVVYYQKVGRKTFEGFYVNPEEFSLKENLPFNIRRVFVYDLNRPFTFNEKIASKLREGQEILVNSYDDPMGILSYRAVIQSIKKVTLEDGTARFDIELETPTSSQEQEETINPLPAVAEDPEAYAPNIRMATTSYSDLFKDLIARSARLVEDATDPNRYLTDKMQKIVRVTADDGPINKMRATPYTKDQEERARAIVDSIWGDRPKTTKLKVKGLEGEHAYEDAYEALLTKFVNIATRGTLIHKYIEFYLTTDMIKRRAIEKEINELHSQVEFNSAYLTTGGWVDVLKKTGVNIFNDVTAETVDKVYPELKIFDDKFTMWGGTADFVYQKANGNFGIRDFKTGWGFNNIEARAMFKYGGGPTRNIMQTPRNTAKLQLMLYAFLMKVHNPSIKFDSLQITWIPSADKLRMYDPQAKVEVGDYLGMVHAYMRNEMKEVYQEMKEAMGDQFDRLWDPEEYEQAYRYNTKLKQEKDNSKTILQEKLDELRKLTFFSLAQYESGDNKKVKTELERRAKDIFRDVMELVNDLGIKEHEINDISFLSLWLSSNAHQLSGYIQLYDKMLRKAKAKVDARKTVYRTKFKAKLEDWLDDHHKVYGKSPLEYIPFTKGLLNFYRSEELFGWLYKEVKDTDGHVIGSVIRTTAEDWEEAKKMFPKYSKWKERIVFAKFLTDTYDSFFLDNKSEYGVAVANRKATVREVLSEEGELDFVEVTNLDLQNEYRRSRQSAPFEYHAGWFPKVPKLLEEFGNIWDKPYLQEVWKRNFTIFNEANYDQEFNNIEVIPMSYLGNEFVDSTGAFSLNAEVQFDKFVSRMLMKEEAEDVYGFGKAMMLYLQAKTKDGSLVYKNTVDYLEKALEMQIRGRREWDVPFLSRNSNLYRTANGDLNRVNWAKVIRSFRSAAAAPIMWLKPLAGTANGVFTYMYTLKEAIKNDIVRSKQIGNFFGINGDEYMFGVKDLMWATAKWIELQKAAMTGDLKNNHMFMLAKHLGYLPTNFGWTEDAANLITTRNKLFDQSTMYLFHSIFEEGVAFITMGAQLHAMKAGDKTVFDRYKLVDKVDEDGTKYKVIEWDGYKRGLVEQKDGSLRELTELDENEIRRLYHVYERMHGGYRADEKTRAEYYLIGEVFMQFKRYLPNVLKNVMGSKGNNYAYGAYVDAPSYKDYKEDYILAAAAVASDGNTIPIKVWNARLMEGRWRSFAGQLLSYLPVKASIGEKESNDSKLKKLLGVYSNESYQWNNLSDGQKEQIVDVYVTAFMYLAILGGYFMMFGGGDDDDILAKYAKRIHQNFFQQVSPLEVARDVISPSSFVPASLRQGWGLLSSSGELGLSLLFAGIGDEDAWTQKGTLRGWSQFQRHVPFLSSYKDIASLFEDLSGEDYSVQIRR